MGIIQRASVLLFAMWLGMGFLVGLTGSVISAPRYHKPVDTTAPLVYNSGLGPKSEAAVPAASQGTSIARPEEIFTTKACIQCHRVTYYDIAGGETGPDLSIAYTDVPNRFGRSLEDFLAEPEGTMGAIIPDRLNDDDKRLILELLIEAAGVDRDETGAAGDGDTVDSAEGVSEAVETEDEEENVGSGSGAEPAGTAEREGL